MRLSLTQELPADPLAVWPFIVGAVAVIALGLIWSRLRRT
jgi:hypothetical protein